jgi:undecaprenyl-diphosphatase
MGQREQAGPRLARMAALAAALLLVLGGVLLLAATQLDLHLLTRLRHPDDPARALGPTWLQESIRDITALGSNTVLAILLLTAATMLSLSGKRRRAIALVLSAAGALVVVNLLKSAFGRERPGMLGELPVLSASFPSSHAMMSATLYLMLGLIVAEAAERPAIGRAAAALAVAVVLVTGLSRIYLGVHWPSDVLAGWALGLGWAIASMRVFAAMEGRGLLEPMRRRPA